MQQLIDQCRRFSKQLTAKPLYCTLRPHRGEVGLPIDDKIVNEVRANFYAEVDDLGELMFGKAVFDAADNRAAACLQ